MDYKDLEVWNKSIQFVTDIYKVSTCFPKSELYGLTNQIRRASVSIPSNIAEGHDRKSLKSYIYFLEVSLASASELETQLYIAKNLEFLNERDFRKLISEITSIRMMLNKLISVLKGKLK